MKAPPGHVSQETSAAQFTHYTCPTLIQGPQVFTYPILTVRESVCYPNMTAPMSQCGLALRVQSDTGAAKTGPLTF